LLYLPPAGYGMLPPLKTSPLYYLTNFRDSLFTISGVVGRFCCSNILVSTDGRQMSCTHPRSGGRTCPGYARASRDACYHASHSF